MRENWRAKPAAESGTKLVLLIGQPELADMKVSRYVLRKRTKHGRFRKPRINPNTPLICRHCLDMTILYRSADRCCRAGAALDNLITLRVFPCPQKDCIIKNLRERLLNCNPQGRRVVASLDRRAIASGA